MLTNTQAERLERIRNIGVVDTKILSSRIEEVKKGSVIMIDQDTYFVDDLYCNSYKKENWNELQLFNLKTGETRYMEVSKDDRVELCLTEKTLKMSSLPVRILDIEDMAEEEEGEFTFNGKTFYYEDDYEFNFRRNGSDKSEKVYLYEFESEDETYLSIEDWDGDLEVHISRDLSLSRVKILSI